MLSGQSDNNGSIVGQSNLIDDDQPARQWGTLEMKEEENSREEASMVLRQAQFVCGPSRWEAGGILLVFGIPKDDRNDSQGVMDPGNQVQAPIRSRVRMRLQHRVVWTARTNTLSNMGAPAA
jgi:hypothetical protein